MLQEDRITSFCIVVSVLSPIWNFIWLVFEQKSEKRWIDFTGNSFLMNKTAWVANEDINADNW